jgi:hypothetical protein
MTMIHCYDSPTEQALQFRKEGTGTGVAAGVLHGAGKGV